MVRDQGNENLVYVVAMYADLETAHAFVDHPDLPAAMAEAGVVGDPAFAFMNVAYLAPPDQNPGSADRMLVVAFVADPATAAAMERAGVTGPPNILFGTDVTLPVM